MIRWNYLLPRLLIILILGITIRLTANPLFKSTVTKSLQSMIGSNVDLDQSDVYFFPPQIRIKHLEIAKTESTKELRNQVELGDLNLKLDASSLLRGQFVIETASIKGIRIHSTGSESNDNKRTLTRNQSESLSPMSFTKTANLLSQELEARANQKIQNLNFSREIQAQREQWQKDFTNLNSEIETIRRDVEGLLVNKNDLTNPLRNLKQVENTLKMLQAKHQSLANLGSKINDLPRRIEEDRQDLRLAKDADLAEIKSALPIPQYSNSRLGENLFSTPVHHLIEQAQEYMEHGETFAKYTFIPPKQQRLRGKDFFLDAGTSEAPLIRSGVFTGKINQKGVYQNFSAEIENFAGDQLFMKDPCRIKVSTRGDHLLKMEYAYQRKSDSRASQITMHWPGGVSRAKNFGSASQSDFSWTAASQELWLQLRKEQKQNKTTSYNGRIINVQRDIHFAYQSSTTSQTVKPALTLALKKKLAEVPDINLDATFTFSGDKLDLDLKSNLPEFLAKATSQVFSDEVNKTREQLQQKVQSSFEMESRELQNWLGTKQTEIASKHHQALQALNRMKARVAETNDDVHAYLGRLRKDEEPSLN